MAFSTCDLCDNNEDKFCDGDLHVLAPIWQHFGACASFSGAAATVKVFEDNVLIRRALESPGGARVLVVDAGGSLRCGMVGGNLARLAQDNNWSGILIDGCVRDVAEINACAIGVRALGSHPRRSVRKGAGEFGQCVTIAGTAVFPGDWIYADADGVLVSRTALSLPSA